MTSNELLVVVKGSPASVAVRVCAPCVLMEQPLKAATPSVVVEVQPESVPGPEAIVRAMALVSVVTVFPPAS